MRCGSHVFYCSSTLIPEQIKTNGSHLAYTLDSGTVGVVDLKTQARMTMKTSHANVRSDKLMAYSLILRRSSLVSSVPMSRLFLTVHANVCDLVAFCCYVASRPYSHFGWL